MVSTHRCHLVQWEHPQKGEEGVREAENSQHVQNRFVELRDGHTLHALFLRAG